ncbi:MAG TPA: tetratricopeptide repeat protein, partial [Candidatus Goldiibacteriota bacterium]|nr:tetratricopeptide repeat protein [Candidatus Goldiibacteriota bacterium]
NYSLARGIFRSIIIPAPESPLSGDAKFMEAESLYASGNYYGALKAFLSIVEKYPHTLRKYGKEIYFRMAGCSLRLKDSASAVRYLEKVLSAWPGSYLERDAWLLMAESRMENQEYDAALDALTRMEKFPDYQNFDYVHYLRGRIYHEKAASSNDAAERSGYAAEAIRNLDRIKTEYPKSRLINHAQFWKANTQYVTGKYRQAVETAQKILANENDAKFRLLVRYFMAWNLYMSGDYGASQREYESIIAADSRDILAVWSLYKKGMCQEALGNEKDALATYAEVIKKYRATVPAAYAAYSTAYYYHKKKDYFEALPMFQELLENYSVEELERASYFMIAEGYLALNEIVKAGDTFKLIREKFPEDKFLASYMEAWCHFRQADYASAKEAYLFITGA